MANAPAIHTKHHRAVLSRYARGEDIADIAAAEQTPHDWVAGAISQLAGFDRGRARLLVQDYDQRALAVIASKPTAPKPAAKPAAKRQPARPATAPTEERKRVATAVLAVTTKHAAEARADLAELNGTPVPAPTADGLADLLTRADASFDAPCKRLATRIRSNIDALHERLAEVAAEQARRDAEAKVAKARAQLEAALAEAARYGVGKQGKARPERAPGEPSPKALRAWAASQRLACSPHGRIPETVVAAWKAAHPDVTTTPPSTEE